MLGAALLSVGLVGGFVLGRVRPSLMASPSSVQLGAQKIAPTQYDRDLMSALNAIQSGIQTGMNSNRYSDLIAAARTKVADLKLSSPESPLVSPASAYLKAHSSALSAWNRQASGADCYISKREDPEFFKLLFYASENPHIAGDSNDPVILVRGGISELWTYTEAKLWSPILAAWQNLSVR